MAFGMTWGVFQLPNKDVTQNKNTKEDKDTPSE